MGTGDTLLPRSSHAPFVRCCTWIPSVGPSTPDTRSHLHLWAFPWSLVRQGETLNHWSLEFRSWYGPHTSLIRFYDYRRSLKLMAINSPPASGLRTVVESSGVCQLRNGRPTLNYITLHSIMSLQSFCEHCMQGEQWAWWIVKHDRWVIFIFFLESLVFSLVICGYAVPCRGQTFIHSLNKSLREGTPEISGQDHGQSLGKWRLD